MNNIAIEQMDSFYRYNLYGEAICSGSIPVSDTGQRSYSKYSNTYLLRGEKFTTSYIYGYPVMLKLDGKMLVRNDSFVASTKVSVEKFSEEYILLTGCGDVAVNVDNDADLICLDKIPGGFCVKESRIVAMSYGTVKVLRSGDNIHISGHGNVLIGGK